MLALCSSTAVATGAGELLSAPPSAASTITGWQATGPLPSWVAGSSGLGALLEPIAIGCASTSVCTGLVQANTQDPADVTRQPGASIFTSDGGAHWSGTFSDIAPTLEPNSVSCPSLAPFVCFGAAEDTAGPGELIETQGGQTWGAGSPMTAYGPDPTTGQTAFGGDTLQCESTASCTVATWAGAYGIGGVFLQYSAGAAHPWTYQIPFSAENNLGSACTTAGCWTDGNAVTGPGGTVLAAQMWYRPPGPSASWQQQSLPSYSGGHPYGAARFVTCVPDPADPTSQATTRCYAEEYTDSGPGGVPVLVVSSDGGLHWGLPAQPPDLTGDSLTGITCASATECFAYGEGANGGFVLATLDGGQSWTSETISGASAVHSISCPDVTDCFAAAITPSGGAVYATNDAGFDIPPAPSAPLDVVATLVAGTTGTIAVSWSAPVFAGLAGLSGYDVTPVDETTGASGATSHLGLVTGTQLSGLTAGHAYEIEVQGVQAGPGGGAGTPAYSGAVVPATLALADVHSVSGSSPSLPATAIGGGMSLAASGAGSGTVSIGDYPGDPAAGFAAGTSYFDVKAGAGISGLSFTACGLVPGDALTWWDPILQAWQPVWPATAVDGTGCASFTVGAASYPSLSHLYGTMFTAAAPASGPGTTTTTTVVPGATGGTPAGGAGSSSGARAPASAPGVGAPVPTPAPATGSASPPPVPEVTILGGELKVTGNAALLRLRCAVARCAGSITLRLAARPASGASGAELRHLQPLRLGRRQFDLRPGRSSTVRFPLSPAAAAALRVAMATSRRVAVVVACAGLSKRHEMLRAVTVHAPAR
jgi:hypothetical protein